ncbi:tetratricopeptide repeat protein [Luteimonas aquatica]|uniref:tetratricopeptide repeat protein n=1 Tax=Luteimonas aquatica TaxID=450364 RepID=UPI0024127F94|nr:tetratricopeptide repeat protein [Luteimonas aquatica]
MAAKEAYRFGDFLLEADQRRLWREDRIVELPPKVFDTLLLLLRHAGELVGRDVFFATLWPNTVVTDASLGRHIWQVRRALGQGEGEEAYIQTVPKQGYRFIAPVRRVEEEDTPAATIPLRAEASPVPSAATGHAGDVPAARMRTEETARRRAGWRWPLLAAALAAAVAAAGGAWWWLRTPPAGAELPAVAIAGSGLVALFDIGADGEADTGNGDTRTAWLGAALSELLDRELSLNESLQVVSGRRLAELAPLRAGQAPDRALLQRLHRQLGVGLAMTGRYRAVPGRGRGDLALELRVFDAASGALLRTVQVEGERARLGELAGAAGERLRDDLGLQRLTTAFAATRGSTSSDDNVVLEDYAEGMLAARRGDGNAARNRLSAAVARAPQFLPAQLALARTLQEQGFGQRSAETARAALARAGGAPRELRLALEAQMYEAEKSWPQAIETYQALYRFYPEEIEYGLGLARAQGKGDSLNQALATLAALRRNGGGDDPRVDLCAADLAEARGDYPALLAASERALKSARSLQAPHLIALALRNRAWARDSLGNDAGALADYGEAARLYRELKDPLGQASTDNELGSYYFDHGDFSRAEPLYRRALVLFEAAGLKTQQIAALSNLANIAWSQDKRGEVKNLLETVLQLGRELGDPERETWTLSALGTVQADMGQTAAALASYRDVIALCERNGLEGQAAWTRREMADLLRLRGEYAQARALAEQSLAVETRLNNRRGEAEALLRLGQVLRDSGDLAGGRARLEASLALSRRDKLDYGAAGADTELAELALRENKPEETLRRLQGVVPVLKNNDAASELAVVDGLRAEALAALRRDGEARAALASAVAFAGRDPDTLDALAIGMSELRVLAALGPREAAAARADALDRQARRRELGGVLAQVEVLRKPGRAASVAARR